MQLQILRIQDDSTGNAQKLELVNIQWYCWDGAEIQEKSGGHFLFWPVVLTVMLMIQGESI